MNISYDSQDDWSIEKGTTVAHVFISYKHEDSEFAALLKLQLIDAGFEAWLDEERLRAGENWGEAIDKAIRDALALIVIMTPEAKASEYVTYEWACAWGATVPVVPILLKPTELHPRLQDLQYLNFTDRKARPWNKLFQRLDELDVQFHPNTVRVSRDVPPSIKKAVEALDSHNPNERRAAIESLEQTNHPAAFEVLASAALHHHIRDVRVEAAFKVAELSQCKDKRALTGLVEALNASSWDVFDRQEYNIRTDAIRLLRKMDKSDILPYFIEILFDNKRANSEYKEVAEAIAEFGDPTAVEPLLQMLMNKNLSRVDLRQIAATTLASMPNSQVVESLLMILEDKTSDVNLRVTVAKSLGEIFSSYGTQATRDAAYEQVREAMLVILRNRREEKYLRGHVAEALGRLRDSQSMPSLLSLLYDPEIEPYRNLIITAIGTVAHESAVASLIPLLDTQDLYVARTVFNALANIGEAATSELIARLSDTRLVTKQVNNNRDTLSEYIYNLAATALEQVGTPNAINALETWRNDNAN